MTAGQKINDFWTAVCTKSHEREDIILFQNIELIVILLFLHVIVLNLREKCPKSYNSEHYSLIMGNKYLRVTIMTDRGCEEITNDSL